MKNKGQSEKTAAEQVSAQALAPELKKMPITQADGAICDALAARREFELGDEIARARKLKQGKKRVVIWTSLIFAACVLLYFFNPENSPLPAACVVSALGYHCPFCGMTRAAHYLLHLNIAKAFSYNQMLIISLPFFLYVYTADAVNTFSGKKVLPLFKFRLKIAVIIICVFLLYGILRNFSALAVLAPGGI